MIEFDIAMKLVRLIKMCLIETYSRVQAGKNMSDKFPIRNGLKQRDALMPFLFNFAVRRVQEKQDGLKCKHQILVYANNANILGGSVHTINENTEALVVTSKEIGLELNADKTTYMIMSQDQNAGRSHNIKIVPLKGCIDMLYYIILMLISTHTYNLNTSKFYSGRK